MQSGIDTSTARLAAYNTDTTTRIDIRPGQQASAGFFGPEGPSFRDVLDAVNPLNHIPIVSDILAQATGHTPSTASQLAGGALLGGPIGFAASLAGVIFKDATGKSPVAAAYAAITGDDSTQVASTTVDQTTQTAAIVPEKTGTLEVASLNQTAAPVDAVTATTNQLQAQATASTAANAKDKAVLDLYGNSTSSAHSSYQKAQLLPYLRDVNTSKVL